MIAKKNAALRVKQTRTPTQPTALGMPTKFSEGLSGL
ncbi:hypothetical protein PENPOL_c002G06132 [Penicillium polonicum]|uniref:Uncharacterized protein n=1 Tax=Penicillium polonicum TaxID=60169 RepID=A0A1V6NXZ5_PENPO|nr:hypothetical protein PENPOL_c002G06132 [Penicillium polonicum]